MYPTTSGRLWLPPGVAAHVTVRSSRYSGPTTRRSTRNPRSGEGRGRAEVGRARKRAVRRRMHWPAGRVQTATARLAGPPAMSIPGSPNAYLPIVSVRSCRYPALRQSGKHRRTASRSGPGTLRAQGHRPVLAVDNASLRLAHSHAHTGLTERLPPMRPMIRRVPRSRCPGVEPQRVSGTATTQ